METKCSECKVPLGRLHVAGCGQEICPVCGNHRISCEHKLEGRKKIPFGTVREIAAKYMHWPYEPRHFARLQFEVEDAIKEDLW